MRQPDRSTTLPIRQILAALSLVLAMALSTHLNSTFEQPLRQSSATIATAILNSAGINGV